MFEVKWCNAADLPIDDAGDADHDGASFTFERFKTEAEAIAAARKLLTENEASHAQGGPWTLAYGQVRVAELKQRRSRWTNRLEVIETRETHLAEIDEVPDWSNLPDYDEED